MRSGWLLALAACKFTPGEYREAPVDDAPLEDDAVVDEDAAVDAQPDAPVDAAWTVAMCPTKYVSYGVASSSRYYLNPVGKNFWNHADDCADDLPGRTHLAAVDSVAEAMAIMTVINAAPGLPSVSGYVLPYAGGIQLRTATMVGSEWLSITGGTLFAGAWNNGEPNDAGGGENDAENFYCFYRGQTYMADVGGTPSLAAVCECDGLPVASEFSAELEATRQ